MLQDCERLMDMTLDFLSEIMTVHVAAMLKWIEKHISDIIQDTNDPMEQLRLVCQRKISVLLFFYAFDFFCFG